MKIRNSRLTKLAAVVVIVLILFQCFMSMDNYNLKNESHYWQSNIKIMKLKSSIVGKTTSKALLNADNTITYFYEPDFLAMAFSKIKKLCRSIRSLQFELDPFSFNIHILTLTGEEINYSKKLSKEEIVMYQNAVAFLKIELKKPYTQDNCDELLSMVSYMEWDYNNNHKTYPIKEIPSFITDPLEKFEIEHYFTNGPKWQ